MTIRVGVVGLGKMGLMHASIMGMLDGVELIALCEKNSLIRYFGNKAIPHPEIVSNVEAFGNKKLDAILVTTPPGSHYLVIKTIYQKGLTKNIFTEKPLAVNYTDALELCRLAEVSGGINMVGYHRRFSVTFRKAKQILDTGVIGHLYSFEAHAYSADFLGVMSPVQAIGRGGVMEDSGCHIVDMVDWLLGEIEVLSARVVSLLGKGSEDEAFITVKTKSGLLGELSVSWCKEGYRLPEMAVRIVGNKGAILVNEDSVGLISNDGSSSTWYKHDLNDFVPFSIGGNEYQRQDELFIQSVRDNTMVEPSFSTASRVEHVIDMARDSVRVLS
jgi:predicted dehydrogenase